MGIVTVFVPQEGEEKYPNSAYEKAALEVKMMLQESKGNGLDINNPVLIREYYQRYFHINEKQFDKEKLGESIAGYDFEKTAQYYRWIQDYSINVLVPYRPMLNEYRELCEIARSRELSAVWLKRARYLAVGSRASKKNALWNYLEPVLDNRGEATNWFLLINPDAYSDGVGLGVKEDDYGYLG